MSKVKEPIAGDLQHLRKDYLLFCYLHLAAEPALTKQLLDIGLTGVAFETVELPNGDLPLLAPMSIVAGKIGVQVGTHLLHQPMRSEEHTSELQSLMRRTYAVLCLTKNKTTSKERTKK